ncbi:nucleotidyltransferase domain-containing protein [Nocardia sp. NEAU-G5]|uniref:Nucleotidyltransferase domain-containing protein n=1 Tax=Nocardia albiluteola TaxID=2842303 RepID=A0ABS6AYN7_9NOCA|nr:nucleotidyltransferase domain-containing protein [Nocardia albiluteola]MBU3063154.1 nucleotidyltransferase domain-containing protein [Nocardia albiluteola]
MPDPRLIAAATAAVHDAFDAAPVFACLTGSTATDTDTADSDIDLLVVLPNDLPLPIAVQQRETFTRNYIRLHTVLGRPPDRQWPAEVCYATDLDAAIDGGAFDLESNPRLRLCPLDHPHRYWVSMTATAIPLIGHTAHHRYAARCATAVINHIGFNQLSTAGAGSEQPFGCQAPEWTQWHIDPTRVGGTRVLEAAQRNPNYRLWRKRLQPPRHPPQLDRWTERWREIASG